MIDPLRFAELKAGGRLPSPSGSVLRLIELLSREDVALPEIVTALQPDPALTGRILKLVNSAAFARPRPAVAISSDVLMALGLPTLRQLVLIFSLVDGQRGGPCASFDYPAFWSRAMARGAAAQTFGSATRLAPAAELFTLGLVADIGRLALATFEPVRYSALIDKADAAAAGSAGTAALRAEEQKTFGFDHDELTEAMLRDWGFPRLFLDTVLLSARDDPSVQPEPTPPVRLMRLTSLMWLSRAFAGLVNLDDAPRKAALDALLPCAEGLNLTPQTFLALADESLQRWREWGQLLGVPTLSLTPFTEIEIADLAAEEIKAADGHTALRVLVVDDDAAMRKLLGNLLAKVGYVVESAVDGLHGFEVASTFHPDIVVTDLSMPRADGLELVRRLRQGERGQALYLVILTAADTEDILAATFAAGADDYVTKPLKPRTLLARLSAGARIVRLQRELAMRNLALAAALRQAEKAAMTDMLTGLPNRRYVIERLTQECAAAERSERSLSVLMLDVDHFKQVNDIHGHDVGDAVLQEIAWRIEKAKRRSDVVARFGGEEFLILTVDTPLEQAARLAERLRAAVGDTPITVGGLALPVTVSIGVAEKIVDCHNIDVVIKTADDALYRAKATGRNRVEAAMPVAAGAA
ncbi:MAG: diguanylate cyclase [Rhodocyclaceae bacterium]|nr:diguanylate cyclase [Rhodocyclaceae bacterium]